MARLPKKGAPRVGRGAWRSESEAIVQSLESRNLYLYPTAQRWLDRTIAKGIEVGTVRDEADVRAVSAALIAAAAEVSPHTRLRAIDFKEGWAKHIGVPGNCPPHRCLFRTILSRQDSLAERLPMYSELLGMDED